jgi:D-alanyl-D-alanine carboxypeptidase
MAKKTKRQQAIMRRNLFLGSISVVLIAAIMLIVWIVASGLGDTDGNSSKQDTTSTPSQTQSTNNTSSESETKKPLDTTPKPVQLGDFEGNANYHRTVLVNYKNLLPQAEIDNNPNLIVFPLSYKKGSTGEVYRKLDKDMWPYLKAMMDDARADGIDIGIISAWRSYNTQKILFDDKVKRLMSSGYSKEAAEKEAATCIALPGSSEHHTGLAVDFNVTSQSFENSKTFKWLKENAENYGFIMRYPSDKMDITGGIIYEPWHWRFVGINIAKEMNSLGMCYEEYCQYKGIGEYVY